MRRYSPIRPLPVVLILALGACDALPGGDSEPDPAAATATDDQAPGILRIEERQVERPDIYSASARGLWDGRFSLGGRWIAVEEKVKHEQVRITNLDNGKVIEGALFPREFELPGPPIMVSMDAAVALGMLAGAPAELQVVVIRNETVEIPAPPPPPKPEEEEKPKGDAKPAAEKKPDADKDKKDKGKGDKTAPKADKKVPAGIETGGVQTTTLAAAATAGGEAPKSARVQVAGGANKAGAEAVVAKLKGAGIPASISETTAKEKPFYRVIAGPFKTKEERDAALAAIRKLGYADAFVVK